MICLACDEPTKHKTQTIQKRVKKTVLDKIAPKDPTAKRPGFYVLLDKPVGGLPSNDGVGRHPVYINGDRLVTFAKMVGGIDDENILEMLRTAKGFRKLVHSVGVSIVGDLPDKVVTFTLGFSGELGSGGSRNSMKITTDGTEHIMVMDEQQWSDSDETPQEFLFELVKPKDIATATVKLYLNDGYTVPEVDPDPPVAFDTPAYGEMIARSCLSTGNNIRIKRVLQQLRDGKPRLDVAAHGVEQEQQAIDVLALLNRGQQRQHMLIFRCFDRLWLCLMALDLPDDRQGIDIAALCLRQPRAKLLQPLLRPALCFVHAGPPCFFCFLVWWNGRQIIQSA